MKRYINRAVLAFIFFFVCINPIPQSFSAPDPALEREIKTYERSLKKKPKDIKKLMALAERYSWAEMPREAIAIYEKVIKLDPDNLDKTLLDQIKDEMEAIKPMKAVFDKDFIQFLDGEHVKEAATKMELAEALMNDIKTFKEKNNCDRLVMVWTGSTEKYIEPT